MTNFSRAFVEQQGKVLYHPAFGQNPVVNPRVRAPKGVTKVDFRKNNQSPVVCIVISQGVRSGATK